MPKTLSKSSFHKSRPPNATPAALATVVGVLVEVPAPLRPSGAGKSTLITAIGLINPPTAGGIVIGGELVMDADETRVDLREFRRRHLGFVVQKTNLIPFLSTVENVQVALEINDAAPRAGKGRLRQGSRLVSRSEGNGKLSLEYPACAHGAGGAAARERSPQLRLRGQAGAVSGG